MQAKKNYHPSIFKRTWAREREREIDPNWERARASAKVCVGMCLGEGAPDTLRMWIFMCFKQEKSQISGPCFGVRSATELKDPTEFLLERERVGHTVSEQKIHTLFSRMNCDNLPNWASKTFLKQGSIDCGDETRLEFEIQNFVSCCFLYCLNLSMRNPPKPIEKRSPNRKGKKGPHLYSVGVNNTRL